MISLSMDLRRSGSTDSTGRISTSKSLGTGVVNKPHTSNDENWQAINLLKLRGENIGLNNFRLLKRLGAGDIGTVYLAQLRGTSCRFAIKVMKKDGLRSRKKMIRAHTEREILAILDHPFLPTMYTSFETEKYLGLVMEYCSGGDLHTLRQKQPNKHFSESAARFYASEVLVALEYLHMMGIIYRDLKPENILMRKEGHIMLSDFDLSLKCHASPMIVKSADDKGTPENLPADIGEEEDCLMPTCLYPHCLFSPLRFHKSKRKSKRKHKPTSAFLFDLPEFLAEPSSARSMSFVGTHEYLAPEIIKGEGHGSAVDWWTFGIFLYELLHGKTPFKGENTHGTLLNVVGQSLKFPETPAVSKDAKELIQGLLVKDPEQRLAHVKGATEIKQHPFFEGVNWALIRSTSPPRTLKPWLNTKSTHTESTTHSAESFCQKVSPKISANSAKSSSKKVSDFFYIDFTNLF